MWCDRKLNDVNTQCSSCSNRSEGSQARVVNGSALEPEGPGSCLDTTAFLNNYIALDKLQPLWCICLSSSIHWQKLARGLGDNYCVQSQPREHLVDVRLYVILKYVFSKQPLFKNCSAWNWSGSDEGHYIMWALIQKTVTWCNSTIIPGGFVAVLSNTDR